MTESKIDCSKFFGSFTAAGIDFFTGVPDSLLKDFCAYISENVSCDRHIIAANEGNAVALGCGYHLATEKIPLIYMQNSGVGNSVNPLLSLADSQVYSIPLVMLIGWRGMPGVKDEPQHVKQGRVQNALLEAMEIPYEILKPDTDAASAAAERIINRAREKSAPAALVVPPGSFAPYKPFAKAQSAYPMMREEAIEIMLSQLSGDEVIVSTTGKTSREVYEYRRRSSQGHKNDFLTVGSMGHTSQIALGISLNTNKKVICLDGDGSAIMHMGSMAVNAARGQDNFIHIVINNGAHDSVGGQPTCGFDIDFVSAALGCGYARAFMSDTEKSLKKTLKTILGAQEGPCFLEVRVKKGARADLGRPATTPGENKKSLMEFLRRKDN